MIVSNGNLHYFWDLERGNSHIITSFPTPKSVIGYEKVGPEPKRLIEERVDDDYIALTQKPNYQSDAAWKNESERPGYVRTNRLRFLRPYQKRAIQALQAGVKDGKERFLFEMATGTGKTLIATAIIKLFLRSGNAARILFLVDRLELKIKRKKLFRCYSRMTTRPSSSKRIATIGDVLRLSSVPFKLFCSITNIRIFSHRRISTSSSLMKRTAR